MARQRSRAKVIWEMPDYYYSWSSPYPAPWRYNASDKTAEFDFTMFDHNLGILLDELGCNIITLASEHRTGGKDHAWIIDGGPWIEQGHGARRENNEALATDLAMAWAKAMGENLKKKGWLDRAYVYVTDEPDPTIVKTTDRYCKVLQQTPPGLRTFAAGYGHHGWMEYHQHVDFLATAYAIKETLRKQFKERGVEYWGVYNRMPPIVLPLANARIMGLDSWEKGSAAYFQYASTDLQNHDFWINPMRFSYYSSTLPGYPAHTFVRRLGGIVSLAVPWPEDEPLPEPRSRPDGSQLIMPVSSGPDNVRFVPARQDRPFAPSLRLEALRKSIDDYEYFEMLRKAAEGTPAESPVRKKYDDLRIRLKVLLEKSNLRTDLSGKDRNMMIVDTDDLQGLRRDVARAVDAALN